MGTWMYMTFFWRLVPNAYHQVRTPGFGAPPFYRYAELQVLPTKLMQSRMGSLEPVRRAGGGVHLDGVAQGMGSHEDPAPHLAGLFSPKQDSSVFHSLLKSHPGVPPGSGLCPSFCTPLTRARWAWGRAHLLLAPRLGPPVLLPTPGESPLSRDGTGLLPGLS